MNPFDILKEALPHPPRFVWDYGALEGLDGLRELFSAMRNTPQNPHWHGEGDVLVHTKRVCEELVLLDRWRALPDRRRDAVALATLLHDAGKPETTRLFESRWISPRHASAGARIARALLWTRFGLCGTDDAMRFRESVCFLIRAHGHPPRIIERENWEVFLLRLAANGELAGDFTWDLANLVAIADTKGRIAPDIPELLDAIEVSSHMARELGCLYGPYPFESPCAQRALFSGIARPGAPVRDLSWGEVRLLCAVPGTDLDRYIAQNAADLPIVAPLNGSAGSDEAATSAARAHLRSHTPFVFCCSDADADARRALITLFESYGARVHTSYVESTGARDASREAVLRMEPPQRCESQTVEWLCPEP